MNCADVMLREIASHRKTNTVWLYLYEVSKIVEFIESKHGMVVARGRGGGEIGSY